mmetsp:Transcript_1092/g.2637  ORF Transcript_1092/g.2637 Transcript_1092/m.2637 type:complete len:355 (+) Transcript_1092:95-1159(+)
MSDSSQPTFKANATIPTHKPDREDKNGANVEKARQDHLLPVKSIFGKQAFRTLEAFGDPDLANALAWLIIFSALILGTYALAQYLPPLTAILVGPELYTMVNFNYQHPVKFDDTWPTYVTDYLLSIIMTFFALAILSEKRTPQNARLMATSSALLFSYSISTFAGAICHHFLAHSLHKLQFRLMWNVCVGAVAVAGGIMGEAASAIARLPLDDKQTHPRFRVPVVPGFCWALWSLFFMGVVISGRFSMAQPACDIFLTGVTQAPPTFYLMSVIISRTSWQNVSITVSTTVILVFGAIANSVLLPTYDILNYLEPSLGVTNTILHAWLCISWGSQGYGLWQFVKGSAFPLTGSSQ